MTAASGGRGAAARRFRMREFVTASRERAITSRFRACGSPRKCFNYCCFLESNAYVIGVEHEIQSLIPVRVFHAVLCAVPHERSTRLRDRIFRRNRQ